MAWGQSIRMRPTQSRARKSRFFSSASSARASRVRAGRNINISRRGLQLSRGELKAVDTSATLAVDTASSVQLLNGIARGDDISERNGRQVVMKALEFKGVTYATTGTGVDQIHRILIVYDHQANAAAPTAANILASNAYLSPANLEYRQRFQILADKLVYINASAEAATGKLVNLNKRMNLPVTFNSGDAGTIADITTGSLYLLVLGSVAAGATAGSITFTARVRYQDS